MITEAERKRYHTAFRFSATLSMGAFVGSLGSNWKMTLGTFICILITQFGAWIFRWKRN